MVQHKPRQHHARPCCASLGTGRPMPFGLQKQPACVCFWCCTLSLACPAPPTANRHTCHTCPATKPTEYMLYRGSPASHAEGPTLTPLAPAGNTTDSAGQVPPGIPQQQAYACHGCVPRYTETPCQGSWSLLRSCVSAVEPSRVSTSPPAPAAAGPS
jgi:hypothetical protein